MRKLKALACGSVVAGMAVAGITVASADSSPSTPPSSTPVKHVVVLFDENISLDHYFGTYPDATNPAGEPAFHAKANTPSINGLTDDLLNNNPNSANPQRLDRSQAVTCSQNHGYGAEQSAFDGGLMDRFVEKTGATGTGCDPKMVMDYYDGNTVTGMWNLAQSFSMSDNSYGTNFGPSTVGAVNLISGQTHGVTPTTGSGIENGTIIGDPDPAVANDDCAAGPATFPARAAGGAPTNIGDMLSDHHLTWGWFQGGFRPTSVDPATGRATCASRHVNVAGASVRDYSPHHNAFAYYPSTANVHHTAPASADLIGQDDPAGTPADRRVNHQYDLTAFDTALQTGKLPAVSFLKAAAFEDGHPGNSDPLDEQRFIARAVDAIEESPEWSSTAIVIAYDDSDGWYDHQMSPIVNPSANPADQLNGAGVCGNVRDARGNVKDPNAYPDRCGYGPRQPLLLISPFAKQNFVDHSVTDQTSIMKFIEDNWQLGRIGNQSFDARAGSLGNMFDFAPDAARAPKVYIDPTTGLVTRTAPSVTPSGQTPASAPAGGDDNDPSQGDNGDQGDQPGDGDQGEQPGDGDQGGDEGSQPGNGRGARRGSTGRRSAPAKPAIKVKCTTAERGTKIKVSCMVTGKDARRGATALRFRLVKGNRVLSTARAVVTSTGKVGTTLKVKRALHGRYTLGVAIAHVGSAAASATSVVHFK